MLTEIVERTRSELPRLRAREAEIREVASRRGAPRGFREALTADGLGVIAEVKRRSPSRGMIDADLDPVAQASEYETGGAAAISVLTEPHYFAGSPDDLTAVRANQERPILRKDFLVDPLQVVHAKAMGADAVLLIMAILSDQQAELLLSEAATWELDVLVEAHTSDEARRAIDCGASILGINNRDLATFAVDLSTAERIASKLPDSIVRVAESGIWTVDDARRMRDAGYDAVLVGEALVRAQDPAGLIKALRI